jgi:hypothetical protein
MGSNDGSDPLHQKFRSRSDESVDREQVTCRKGSAKLRYHCAWADGPVSNDFDSASKNNFARFARRETFGGSRNGRTPVLGAA